MKITLRAARVNKDLTLDEVAKAINKSKQTVINYEKGRCQPSIEIGKALATLYGCTVDDLIFLPSNCALSTTEVK